MGALGARLGWRRKAPSSLLRGVKGHLLAPHTNPHTRAAPTHASQSREMQKSWASPGTGPSFSASCSARPMATNPSSWACRQRGGREGEGSGRGAGAEGQGGRGRQAGTQPFRLSLPLTHTNTHAQHTCVSSCAEMLSSWAARQAWQVSAGASSGPPRQLACSCSQAGVLMRRAAAGRGRGGAGEADREARGVQASNAGKKPRNPAEQTVCCPASTPGPIPSTQPL